MTLPPDLKKGDMMRFIPRPIFRDDLISISEDEREIKLIEGRVRYYEMEDICVVKGKKFYQVLARDFHEGTLIVKEVTSQVGQNI